jgi:hypothetical protein
VPSMMSFSALIRFANATMPNTDAAAMSPRKTVSALVTPFMVRHCGAATGVGGGGAGMVAAGPGCVGESD